MPSHNEGTILTPYSNHFSTISRGDLKSKGNLGHPTLHENHLSSFILEGMLQSSSLLTFIVQEKFSS